MAATADRTPTFSQLATFNLGGGGTSPGTKRPHSPTFSEAPLRPYVEDEDDATSEDEPVLQEIRSLSVSSDASMDSVESKDEAVTPPHSPRQDVVAVHTTPSQDLSLSVDEGKSTPVKAPIPTLVTPDSINPARYAIPFFGDVTPPTPPRTLSGTVPSRASLTSPDGGVAARRAAAGKLPNKALVSLQQMRFEAADAGMGLGVGPGSPGFEGLEGISPGPGMTFRLALGLTGKDGQAKGSPTSEGTENSHSPSSQNLASPSLLRTPSSTSIQQRRRLNRSPTSPSGEPVKIPPTLRGSKILDKLNLSSPAHLASPLSPAGRGPPSPLIMRSSAYTYSNTGPLTPLTPSHIPGAPDLSGGGGFDYFSTPDSPARAMFMENSISPGVSPRQAYFLPTPPSDFGSGRPALSRSQSTLTASSPFNNDRPTTNPFFTPV